mmetsp:Transcript_14572/g.35173  ORF Transcript_14572/g.35173 Transcript_14572/m.35173 type:complete len:227 (-) Transcript_14572:20-700(-)
MQLTSWGLWPDAVKVAKVAEPEVDVNVIEAGSKLTIFCSHTWNVCCPAASSIMVFCGVTATVRLPPLNGSEPCSRIIIGVEVAPSRRPWGGSGISSSVSATTTRRITARPLDATNTAGTPTTIGAGSTTTPNGSENLALPPIASPSSPLFCPASSTCPATVMTVLPLSDTTRKVCACLSVTYNSSVPAAKSPLTATAAGPENRAMPKSPSTPAPVEPSRVAAPDSS